jgi:methyltransferase
MSSAALYGLFIGLTALERLVELVVSRRNASWSFQRGGKEFGQGHFPAMVALHTGFLLACPAEVFLLERAFSPLLGWPMLAVALLSQGLRWWCIGTLGQRWNTRVIIVPGMPRIRGGPYRYLNHPNYLAVVLEGLALPLMHSAWLTAIGFTALNAWLLSVRLRCEEKALGALTTGELGAQ